LALFSLRLFVRLCSLCSGDMLALFSLRLALHCALYSWDLTRLGVFGLGGISPEVELDS
jgi:hypothetical protein